MPLRCLEADPVVLSFVMGEHAMAKRPGFRACLFAVIAMSLMVMTAMIFPMRASSAPVPPIHNSDRFACDNSLYLNENDCVSNGGNWSPGRKWAGGWGVIDGKYGEFTCTTCHMRKSPNIKRIKPLLSAPNGVDQLPIEAATAPYNAVVFSSMKEGTSDFGNDEGGHTASVKICESCHTNTSYHRYDTSSDPDGVGPLTAQTKLNHFNNSDCIQCHKHSDGFKPSCGDCHTYPPAWQSHGRHFYPGVTSNIPACVTCHETSVHLNALSEIRFDSSDWMVSGGSYDGSEPSRYTVETGYNPTTPAYGRCDNIYCHSNAQPDGGVGPPQILTTPTWGDSNIATCGFCHKSGVHGDTGPQIDSGSHTAHLAYGFTTMNTPVNPIKCTACHTANTIPPKVGVLAFNCSGCHTTRNPDLIFPLFQAMHVDGDVTINLHLAFGEGNYSGTPAPGDGYGHCSELYCHSDGTSIASTVIPANTTPAWGDSGNLTCDSCHENGPSYANGTPKANSHVVHLAQSLTCNQCHYTTTKDGTSITSRDTHVNLAYDIAPAADVSFTYTFDAGGGTCNNITCHGDTAASWGGTSCLGCHSVVQGARAAVGGQFGANSHHIQGVQVTDSHCYACHWEASSDGTISAVYHGGAKVPGATVDLVIYGNGIRPVVYSVGSSAVSYRADGSRPEVARLNDHCLGCHNDQNSATEPFGDGKTPQEYAWDRNNGEIEGVAVDFDGTSIDSRYSQTLTTTLGKYAGVANAAQKIQTKAYSAHGNATNNQGGWSSGAAPAGTGVDGSLPNTRNGTVNVVCYDCHNSHGSPVEGITTSYNSATGIGLGGILKSTQAGRGGYAISYQPVSGGSASDKNQRNSGASLCFDCHLTANGASTTPQKPWGYQATFGATKQINGYYDSPYFASGGSGSQVRYPYKNQTDFKGGHFGASSPLDETPDHSIGGLCTPCHDPHGVSPNINQEYAIPLLKGTWMTSIYKEDVAPDINDVEPVPYGTHYFSTNFRGNYHIDQNTFGPLKEGVVAKTAPGISEDSSIFAGLCLRCHPQESLTTTASLASPNAWKSKDRVHESVYGWKTSTDVEKHKYTCSKCHAPHSPNGLPRLMITNCLDSNHKGRVLWQDNPGVAAAGINLAGDWSDGGGEGYGSIPGGHIAWYDNGLDFDHRVTCHDSPNANDNADNGKDQSWNSVTPWAPPLEISGLTALQSYEGVTGKETILWTTNLTSDTFLDYWWDPENVNIYNSTSLVTNHQVALTGLDNHQTYYIQARSEKIITGQIRQDTVNSTFYISLPPTVPVPVAADDVITLAATSVTLGWAASNDPIDNGPIEYYAELSTKADFSTLVANSGWSSGTSWTTPALATNAAYYWHVKTRDANHKTINDPESAWSVTDKFILTDGVLPQITLVSPTHKTMYEYWLNSGETGIDVTFKWNSTREAVLYRVLISLDSSFSTIKYNSGWITEKEWTGHVVSSAPDWWIHEFHYWKVQGQPVGGGGPVESTDIAAPWYFDLYETE